MIEETDQRVRSRLPPIGNEIRTAGHTGRDQAAAGRELRRLRGTAASPGAHGVLLGPAGHGLAGGLPLAAVQLHVAARIVWPPGHEPVRALDVRLAARDGVGNRALPSFLPGVRRGGGLPDRNLAVPRVRARHQRSREPGVDHARRLGGDLRRAARVLAHVARSHHHVDLPAGRLPRDLADPRALLHDAADGSRRRREPRRPSRRSAGGLALPAAQRAHEPRHHALAAQAPLAPLPDAPAPARRPERRSRGSGAAATTTRPCTEAMSHPTPSQGFAISRALETQIARAAGLVAGASSVVALTGAGLSVESGIPPFRGPGGLWTKYGEPPLDGYQRFLRDPERAWRDRLSPREPWAQALAETLGRGQAQRRPSRARRARGDRPLRRHHHPEHRRPPPPGRRPRADRDPRQSQAPALSGLRRALRARGDRDRSRRAPARAVPAAGAW